MLAPKSCLSLPPAYLNGLESDFSRPGKPTHYALIGAFNGDFAKGTRMRTGSCPWRTLGVGWSWRRHSKGGKLHSALWDGVPVGASLTETAD